MISRSAQPVGKSTMLAFADQRARRAYGKPFAEVTPDQRLKLLDAAAKVGAYQPRRAPAPNE
jgi:hypothetical protein